MGSELRVEVLSGRAIERVIGDLAALRIAVFREYPYLYEGSAEYEARYLRDYACCEQSCVVIASIDDRVVGASTALPLLAHSDEVVRPLAAAGFDPSEVFYLGESVLLPEYRGRGLGHRFFDEREAAASRHGFALAAFCAVVRPPGHPDRPADYVPHDVFWTKRRYVRRSDIVGRFRWREPGQLAESEKPMEFWIRELSE